jgi:predicted nuclease with TOPRIM domain
MAGKLALTADFIEAVRDHLPEVQISTLRNALNELDQLRDKSENQAAEIKVLEGNVKAYRAENSELEQSNGKLDDLNETLKTRNEELEKQAVKNEVEVIKSELKGVTETTDKFLKNTIYREKLQHQVTDEYPATAMDYQNGNSVNRVVGVNKTSRPVTDLKESETE